MSLPMMIATNEAHAAGQMGAIRPPCLLSIELQVSWVHDISRIATSAC
jgi:hypothetical protein